MHHLFWIEDAVPYNIFLFGLDSLHSLFLITNLRQQSRDGVKVKFKKSRLVASERTKAVCEGVEV